MTHITGRESTFTGRRRGRTEKKIMQNEKKLHGISMIEYLCKGLIIHLKFEPASLSIELIAIARSPVFHRL
jgi:hypothetical protein